MRGRAFAKVNLGLRVGPRLDDGLHTITSLAQSVDWADSLEIDRGSGRFEATGPAVPVDDTNLVNRAIQLLGRDSGDFDVALHKGIPVAAGLGGGSADAALTLALVVAIHDDEPADAVAVASELGADVPFCLAGGTAWVEGVGEQLTRLEPVDDRYWLAVVVPPFELGTADVYARWDQLDGPTGSPLPSSDLPTGLRDLGPLQNDLTGAAVDLEPALGDWISDVADRWGQEVMMSGSGPSLFSFFASLSEAQDAAGAVGGARAGRAVAPVDSGWEFESEVGLPGAPWGF